MLRRFVGRLHRCWERILADLICLLDTTSCARVLFAQSRGAGEESAGSGEDRAGEAGEFGCCRRWCVVARCLTWDWVKGDRLVVKWLTLSIFSFTTEND